MMTIMPEITMKDSKRKLWKLYEYSNGNTVSLGPQLLKAMMIADTESGLNYFSPLKAGNFSKTWYFIIKCSKVFKLIDTKK